MEIASEKVAKAAKSAFEASQLIDSSVRVRALSIIKDELANLKGDIEKANELDLEGRWVVA